LLGRLDKRNKKWESRRKSKQEFSCGFIVRRRKKMSMSPQGLQPIPEETERIARRSFPKGTLAMQLRDELGPIYSDEQFVDLFAKRGKGAFSPSTLALVTVLQAAEGLTDRQAAHAVRGRLDWKYALGLAVDDAGFDASVLTEFRARLVEHAVEDLVLGPIIQLAQKRGWIKAGGKQRTDSTAVLASVRALSSLESVGECMRMSLNALAEINPSWLQATLHEDWFDRYVHRFELARFPKAESQRQQLRAQVGQDVEKLLGALDAVSTPEDLRQLPEISLLRQIFDQHYEKTGEHVQWRDGPKVQNHERVVSPYDAEARESRKRDTTWLGWKVHLTETCDQDSDVPHLITHVETTPATVQDCEVMEEISEDLRTKQIAPSEHFVDQGYTSGEQLVKQSEQGTQIVGLVQESTSWQKREQMGYAAEDFELDWQQRVATCPQGQQSRRWVHQVDRRGQATEVIQFAAATCQACPVRESCTRNQQGRTLTLLPQKAHQAVEDRRVEQKTPEFLQNYHTRAGVEGTVSQALRTTSMRRSPYIGLQKTHGHHVAIAAGINLIRIGAHLQAQARGKPSRHPRLQSPFARLQPLKIA
jgi:transposase